MKSPERIIWSNERKKWLCYDDKLIDVVFNSKYFVVPTYDYSDVETKFNKNFEFTKQVISHFPLANDGDAHLYLRERMSHDVNTNLRKAINVFKENFENKITTLVQTSGAINIATPIIQSILESNWVFANIDLEESIDYSDLTLMLDDSQSIKSRLFREEFIKLIASKVEEKDRFYKLALISVGVNALISTTLHSFIKVLTNYDYNNLISRKYFYSNGIKHLERVCIQNTVLGEKEIKVGERLRLYVESYEHANLVDSQINRKFFAAESNHSCIGMSYSLSIWKELIKLIQNNFTDLRIINFDYRSNDAIFNFPINVYVEYSK
jgi:hypothetical protein